MLRTFPTRPIEANRSPTVPMYQTSSDRTWLRKRSRGRRRSGTGRPTLGNSGARSSPFLPSSTTSDSRGFADQGSSVHSGGPDLAVGYGYHPVRLHPAQALRRRCAARRAAVHSAALAERAARAHVLTAHHNAVVGLAEARAAIPAVHANLAGDQAARSQVSVVESQKSEQQAPERAHGLPSETQPDGFWQTSAPVSSGPHRNEQQSAALAHVSPSCPQV
jgi:hypothetical protein